jgi:hypothetical protein
MTLAGGVMWVGCREGKRAITHEQAGLEVSIELHHYASDEHCCGLSADDKRVKLCAAAVAQCAPSMYLVRLVARLVLVPVQTASAVLTDHSGAFRTDGDQCRRILQSM